MKVQFCFGPLDGEIKDVPEPPHHMLYYPLIDEAISFWQPTTEIPQPQIYRSTYILQRRKLEYRYYWRASDDPYERKLEFYYLARKQRDKYEAEMKMLEEDMRAIRMKDPKRA